MKTVDIAIITPFIRLDALLKLAGAVESGGQAKFLIQTGHVLVNGAACEQRGKKLVPGDTAQLREDDRTFRVITA